MIYFAQFMAEEVHASREEGVRTLEGTYASLSRLNIEEAWASTWRGSRLSGEARASSMGPERFSTIFHSFSNFVQFHAYLDNFFR